MQALVDWLKPRLIAAFWFSLALVFLLESWIWDHVKLWLRQLERALGLERIEAWLEGLVARLSPQMTLALFAIPMIAILPFKVAALAMLTRGHIISGVVFIFLAKSLTLGVEAFLFDICRDRLLEMPWFRRFYSMMLAIRAWASLLVKPLKTRALAVWADVRERALAFISKDVGELRARIVRLREAVRHRPRA